MKIRRDIQEILDTPEYQRVFFDQFKDCFKIEKRFDDCSKPIRLKVKSFRIIENGLDIEFYNQDDADLFWDNQDKEIELVFNSPE